MTSRSKGPAKGGAAPPTATLANVKFPITLRLVGRPVPCPRPRLSRGGHAYYPATYTSWVTEALPQVARQLDLSQIVNEDVTVWLEVLGEAPKRTVRTSPHGDVDNFAKSALDLMTKAMVWTDDNLIRTLTVSKRWCHPGEDPGYHVVIDRI